MEGTRRRTSINITFIFSSCIPSGVDVELLSLLIGSQDLIHISMNDSVEEKLTYDWRTSLSSTKCGENGRWLSRNGPKEPNPVRTRDLQAYLINGGRTKGLNEFHVVDTLFASIHSPGSDNLSSLVHWAGIEGWGGKGTYRFLRRSFCGLSGLFLDGLLLDGLLLDGLGGFSLGSVLLDGLRALHLAWLWFYSVLLKVLINGFFQVGLHCLGVSKRKYGKKMKNKWVEKTKWIKKCERERIVNIEGKVVKVLNGSVEDGKWHNHFCDVYKMSQF